jgi:DNA-binding transcriptional MocR family regulator
MRVDLLEAVLERHRVKLIYTLPTFQNPSGAVLSLERRRRLLELAYRHRVPVLEDDVYFELRYDGEPLPSLAALDEEGYVLHLSSFSKVLFPGLRLGFLVAPRPVVRQLCLAKQAVDLHSSTAGQWLVHRFLRDGHYERHVRTIRAAYVERRTAMEQALRGAGVPGLTWNTPAGGFYFWCRVPRAVPEAQLLARAAEAGVAYLPGAACFAEEPPAHHLRLNFSYPDSDQIREGVRRLAAALHRVAADPVPRARAAGETPPIV